jgi:hypothetical protein
MKLLSKDKNKRPSHEEILSHDSVLNLETLSIEMDDNSRKSKFEIMKTVSSLPELQRQVQE